MTVGQQPFGSGATQQLFPVFGVKPVNYADHSKTNGVGAGGAFGTFIPKLTDDLKTNDDCLTFISGGALAVAPADGWRLTQLRLMNTGAIDVVSVWLATAYNALVLIGVVSVPANAGTDGTTPAVNALNATLFPDMTIDAAGNKYQEIGAGKTIVLTSGVTQRTKSFATIQTYAAP